MAYEADFVEERLARGRDADDYLRLAGEPVQQHLEAGKQRDEERASQARTGLFDFSRKRFVQIDMQGRAGGRSSSQDEAGRWAGRALERVLRTTSTQ